jgi:hypothetical protein
MIYYYYFFFYNNIYVWVWILKDILLTLEHLMNIVNQKVVLLVN